MGAELKDRQVEPGATVGLAFQIFKIEADGREVSAAQFRESDPTERVVGEEVEPGDMWDNLKELERRLLGLRAGDRFDVRLEAEQAFGPRREDKVFVLTGDQVGEFLSGVGVRRTDWDCISVGEWHDGDEMEIDGRPVEGTVIETGPERIILDQNHALAGHPLRIVGSVVFVR